MTEAAFKKPLSTQSALQHAKGEQDGRKKRRRREMIKMDNLNMGGKDNSTERDKIQRERKRAFLFGEVKPCTL